MQGVQTVHGRNERRLGLSVVNNHQSSAMPTVRETKRYTITFKIQRCMFSISIVNGVNINRQLSVCLSVC